MFLKKLTFLFFIFVIIHISSQTLDKFEYLGEIYGNNESYFGIYPTFTSVNNPKAPFPERHNLKGWTGELSYRKVNFEKGKYRCAWQHKMIVDVLLILDQALQKGNDKAIYRKENTALTNGLLGWFDIVWNINNPSKKILYSVGLNHNDYFYGSTYSDSETSSEWYTPEPQGYYLAVGPSCVINYLPFQFLMLELSTSYSFSYHKAVDVSYATNKDASYPLPHWGQIDLELQTKWGIFSGINYNWIINRGNLPSSGKRLDLLVGFRFMI